MRPWEIYLRRGRDGFMRVLILALFLAGSVTGGGLDFSTVRPQVNCGSDVVHPFTLEVVPLTPIRPGAPVTARIVFESRVPLDEVSLRIQTPRDLTLLSAPASDWGRMRAAESRQAEFTVIVPRSGPRRTVEVTVEGKLDGSLIRRGAILNLAGSQEPFRLVTTADGRKIREVPARKLP